MKNGMWAGEAIATNLERIADNDRSNRVLRQQKCYHCGDNALQLTALKELRRVDPDNALFKPGVQNRIYLLGKQEMLRHGWDRGYSFQADPREVHAQLQSEFEEARRAAISASEKEPVKHRRVGWWWARTDEFSWQKQVVATREEALQLQAAEIARLADASLGEQL